MADQGSSRRLLKAAGAVALTAGLAAGGYGVAAAAGGQGGPSGASPSAGAGTSGGGAAAPGPRDGMGGRWAPFPMGRRHGAMGVVAGVGTSSFTVTDRAGNTRTVETNSSTTYRRDGAVASFKDLRAGERVAVRPVRPSGSSATPPAGPPAGSSPITAAAVDIMDPAVAGTFQSLDGSTLVVQDPQGFWRSIDISKATFEKAGSPATASDLKAGSRVVAFGTVDPNHTTLDAIRVEIDPVRPGPGADEGMRHGPGGAGMAGQGMAGQGMAGPGMDGPGMGGPGMDMGGPAGPGPGSA